MLSCEEAIVKHIGDIISCDTFRHLVEQQYRLNDIALKEKRSFTADWRWDVRFKLKQKPSDISCKLPSCFLGFIFLFSEVGVTVALKTLDLMNKLRTNDKNIKVCNFENYCCRTFCARLNINLYLENPLTISQIFLIYLSNIISYFTGNL